MGIHSKALEALIPSDDTKFSPNEVQAIFIGVDFVAVAYFTRLMQVRKFPQDEALADLERTRNRFGKNGYDRAISRLFENHQLSCLEEIYVEPRIIAMRAFDLKGYLSENVNSASRLRAYGVIPNLSKYFVEIETYFHDNEEEVSYFGENCSFKSEVVAYNNSKWYTKYNLRPTYYSKDKEGGRLHQYFVRKEKEAERLISIKRHEELQGDMNAKAIKAMVADSTYLRMLEELLRLKNYLSQTSYTAVDKVMLKTIEKNLELKDSFKPDFPAEVAEEAYMNMKSRISLNDAKKMVSLYSKMGKKITKISDIPAEGFLEIPTRILKVHSEAIEKLSKSSRIDLIMAVKKGTVGEDVLNMSDLLERSMVILEALWAMCGVSKGVY